MDNLVRIDFEEVDRQWKVTLVYADGNFTPGEPFAAYGGDGFTKLEQVLQYVKDLGYRAKKIPYSKVNASRYTFEVTASATQ